MSHPSPVDLSILIVHHNNWQLLARCLTAIVNSTVELSIEIWVIDNGSTDESISMLCKHFPNVLLLENHKNIGFAAANNKALPLCTGRYILLLNNDAFVTDGTLRSLNTFMEEHPTIGAAGPQLLNPDNSIQPSCMRFPSIWYAPINFIKSKLGGGAKYIPRQRNSYALVDSVVGACMIVPTSDPNRCGNARRRFFYVCRRD